jgi:hypothetical protein
VVENQGAQGRERPVPSEVMQSEPLGQRLRSKHLSSTHSVELEAPPSPVPSVHGQACRQAMTTRSQALPQLES